jgi:hypothetical protein
VVAAAPGRARRLQRAVDNRRAGESDAEAQFNTALRIQNKTSDTSTLLGAMLDGPFTDVGP